MLPANSMGHKSMRSDVNEVCYFKPQVVVAELLVVLTPWLPIGHIQWHIFPFLQTQIILLTARLICTLPVFIEAVKSLFTLSIIPFVILLSSAISGGFSSCFWAKMDATRTTGRGTSLGTNRTELKGIVHILIFLKDLDLAE